MYIYIHMYMYVFIWRVNKAQQNLHAYMHTAKDSYVCVEFNQNGVQK